MNEQLKKPEDRFKRFKKFANTSAKRIALALGIFTAASGPLFSENDANNEKLNQNKPEEYFKLSKEQGFVAFDDFNFENIDPIKDKSSKYGYKLQGQKKMVGELRNYYGVDSKVKAPTGCPFNIQKSREELNKIGTKKLSEFYFVFNENGKALFYNFDLEGKAHICELDEDVEVFIVEGKVYAVSCGNLLIPVSVQGISAEEEYVPTKEDFKKNLPLEEKKETKIEVKLFCTTYRWNQRQGRLPILARSNSVLVIGQNKKPISENVPKKDLGKYLGRSYFISRNGEEIDIPVGMDVGNIAELSAFVAKYRDTQTSFVIYYYK